jgi:predicted deacylase
VAHRIEALRFKPTTLGTERAIKVHRIGRMGARPMAYLQAGLHANEAPGYLILHHLLGALLAADAQSDIVGEIVLVPYANPIGLSGHVLGTHIGRYALETGINFNRGFPDLAALAAPKLAGRLGPEADANVAFIRTAIQEVLANLRVKTEIEDLRVALLKMAANSDILVDLHCEEDAQFAMILGPWCWPGLQNFAAEMQPDALLLADFPPLFDTACSKPWSDLATRFPEVPIPQGCLSSTLEMRGVSAVDDEMATADARNLFAALTRMGVIAGPSRPLSASPIEPVPFRAVEFVKSPSAGLVVYHHELGQSVEAGEVIAEIVDFTADDPARARSPVRSTQAGRLFARCHTMLVRPDETVGKVIGAEPLAEPNHY